MPLRQTWLVVISARVGPPALPAIEFRRLRCFLGGRSARSCAPLRQMWIVALPAQVAPAVRREIDLRRFLRCILGRALRGVTLAAERPCRGFRRQRTSRLDLVPFRRD